MTMEMWGDAEVSGCGGGIASMWNMSYPLNYVADNRFLTQ